MKFPTPVFYAEETAIAILRLSPDKLRTLQRLALPSIPTDLAQSAVIPATKKLETFRAYNLNHEADMPLPQEDSRKGTKRRADADHESPWMDNVRVMMRDLETALDAKQASWAEEKSALEADAEKLRERCGVLEDRNAELERELQQVQESKDAEITGLQRQCLGLEIQAVELEQDGQAKDRKLANLGKARKKHTEKLRMLAEELENDEGSDGEKKK